MLAAVLIEQVAAETATAPITPWLGEDGQRASDRQVGQYDHEDTARLEAIADAGHFPTIDCPGLFARLLDDRLESPEWARQTVPPICPSARPHRAHPAYAGP